MIEALGGFWFIVAIIVLLVIGDRRERRKQFERLLVDLEAYEAELRDLQAKGIQLRPPPSRLSFTPLSLDERDKIRLNKERAWEIHDRYQRGEN